jgi:hypothetical protein
VFTELFGWRDSLVAAKFAGGREAGETRNQEEV